MQRLRRAEKGGVMIEVKEVKLLLRDGVELIAKRYKTLNECVSYEYYLFFTSIGKNLFPPQSLNDEQVKMSVQEYIDNGRHEWFKHVKLGDYYRAWKLLNE